MLPLQITLEGFMSYRDAATLSFEGASLWMLAGQNGAGKSSVFDAMRWTLFNRHRGGGQGQEALIHHQKQKMRVAFDLELATGSFRLIRTLARGGKSTWQIETPDGEKVPETDMRDGYNRWLSENVGLSDETFCAAFYLAQGKGDAILSANPEQRYEMLAEIVDLSAYQRLHETARSRASELESEARFQRAQFEAAPDAPEGEIERLAARLKAVAHESKVTEAQRAQLAQWEPWAAQWQRVEQERSESEQHLESARQLLRDAPRIERDFARLGELESVLPPLRQWIENRERAAQTTRELATVGAVLEVAQHKASEAEMRLVASRQRLASLETERQKQEAARLEALSRLNELAPLLSEARNLESRRAELAQLETKFDAFPVGLEEQRSALEAKISAAQEKKLALASLTRFERARQEWCRAAEDEKWTREKAAESEAALSQMTTDLRKAECEREQSLEEVNRSAETLTAAQVRRRDAEGALQRLNEVKGETNCHFCGQKLTPEHAAREENRLLEALEEAQAQETAALEQQQKAKVKDEEAKSRLQSAQKALRQSEKSLEKSRSEGENAVKLKQTAAIGAGEVLNELSSELAARFDGQSDTVWNQARVDAALRGHFPSPHDFEALQSEVDQLESWQEEAKRVGRDMEARSLVVAQMEAIRQQIAPLDARYPVDYREQIYAEEREQRDALEYSWQQMVASDAALEEMRAAVQEAEALLSGVRQESAQCETRLAGLRATQVEIERALATQQETASAPLQSLLQRLESELATDFERWTDERRELESHNLAAQMAQLNQVRQQVAELEQGLVQLEKTREQIPEAARRPLEALRAEMEGCAATLSQTEQERRQLDLELSNLKRLATEKARLRELLLQSETSARQHKTLADLLGPQQLQRYLLREAENGIVDESNSILDRISTGTLRLELRADDDEIAGARKGAPKILDVAIFQTGGEGHVGQGMLPAFLSGSQRFRVAVALALGIGRYATRGQGHSRLEAVIIDEGFGSLDKIGRGEMIDELKSLGDELKRVILVSHQEEFAEAFSNRYLIENDGSASTARLMVD